MTFFSLTPTFTQGLVLGQLSILLLLAFILRYLFFDTNPPSSAESETETDAAMTNADKPRDRPGVPGPTLHALKDSFIDEFPVDATRRESLEWFNLLLNGVRRNRTFFVANSLAPRNPNLPLPLDIVNTNVSRSFAWESYWYSCE